MTDASTKHRVLVVEDDRIASRALEIFLTGLGCEVMSAPDGIEALRLAREALPEIILTDLGLPKMDGYTLLDELRVIVPQSPVIVMTGSGELGSAVRAMRAGADNYLEKPLDLDALAVAMDRALERARLRTEVESFFTLSTDLLCIVGFDGLFRRLNAAWEKTLGFNVAELKARAWLELVDADDRSALTSYVAMLAGKNASASFEARFRCKDGGFRWLRMNAAVARGKDSIYVVGRDITRDKLAHEEAERHREELQRLVAERTAELVREHEERLRAEERFRHAQKMEAVGRLAGGVAHDFNNVLSVVLGYAGMLLGELRPDDPMRADIEEIKKAGERAASLTRQLLAFSRQQVLQPRVLELNQIIGGMERMIGRLLGADIQLNTSLDANLGTVLADPGQIEQIIMNLAVNARDAMPQGGKLFVETRNVEVDEAYTREHPEVRPGSYVMIQVSDTGLGMAPETMARVFEPFFTTKEKGKGTGLGLATVFGIVEQSGGHIALSSEIDKGTTFRIYLPQVTGEVRHRSSVPPEARLHSGHATILLVEDDEQVRSLALSILRRHGYTVLEASNGGEALLVCEEHQGDIDLLLTDVVLPRQSGRQIAERLSPLRPGMKVLFMSGYTDDAAIRHGLIASGVRLLQKPITAETLTRKVSEVLVGS